MQRGQFRGLQKTQQSFSSLLSCGPGITISGCLVFEGVRRSRKRSMGDAMGETKSIMGKKGVSFHAWHTDSVHTYHCGQTDDRCSWHLAQMWDRKLQSSAGKKVVSSFLRDRSFMWILGSRWDFDNSFSNEKVWIHKLTCKSLCERCFPRKWTTMRILIGIWSACDAKENVGLGSTFIRQVTDQVRVQKDHWQSTETSRNARWEKSLVGFVHFVQEPVLRSHFPDIRWVRREFAWFMSTQIHMLQGVMSFEDVWHTEWLFCENMSHMPQMNLGRSEMWAKSPDGCYSGMKAAFCSSHPHQGFLPSLITETVAIKIRTRSSIFTWY